MGKSLWRALFVTTNESPILLTPTIRLAVIPTFNETIWPWIERAIHESNVYAIIDNCIFSVIEHTEHIIPK